MGSEYREALLAAARVCRERGRHWVTQESVASAYCAVEAEACAKAILALAEQEDQRGAAATAGKPEEAVAGETRNGMQSAPHPDPAGQQLRATGDSESGTSPQAALPVPETVSEQRLWLWKNFVDGKPEYFAFDNPFPCYGNGDPMTFGEPVGYAILKPSTRSRNAVDDEYELARLINRNRQEKSAAKETVPVPREPTEAMLEAVRKVADEIPPYIGLTGNALNEQIWKAIRAMLAAGSAK